ncbi:chloroplast lipoate protein ligase [Obba rivulosa]|uniref:lipoyl(octanoyl) transferase n=1 Tax=Obba rivulosa TaxID=1052685 RepID=A0A8E2DIA9_9APHY|nr:chloroplast lipoate protein ligase [Obba rivulosa]
MAPNGIFYHYFRLPLPYARTLALQEQIHALQLLRRRESGDHKDVLLLLQHRPVYTAGRRQRLDLPEVQAEAARLRELGADFVATQRGGETTYHGPGQIVGYPLIDLGRYNPTMAIRSYVCNMQKLLQTHLLEGHGVRHTASEHTGVFLDQFTKIASIGVHVRHRLTSHGFAMNITREPRPWFDRVVACGLVGVRAGCIADVTDKKDVTVEGEIGGLVERFGRLFGREMVKLDVEADEDVSKAIREVEEDAKRAGEWLSAPAV